MLAGEKLKVVIFRGNGYGRSGVKIGKNTKHI